MKDRYEILEQLGEGGAGAVYKAWDSRLQRYVAIKRLLPPDQREGDGVGTDLGKEAAALSALQHPNVVSVYDLDLWEGEPCVVMEYLNGETLEQTMRRGALTPQDFYEVARQSLEGLEAAHRLGVQHRDIKPSNIMVNWLPSGDFLVKVLDFGLADFTARPDAGKTAEGDSAYGSVHFMAPEQFTRGLVDARTDLYSLGCVLYYALTTAYPFGGRRMEDIMNAHLAGKAEPLHAVRADIPRLVCDWVCWLMSRQPEDRPGNAHEALETLKEIRTGTLKALPKRRTAPAPESRVATGPVKAATSQVRRPTGQVPRRTAGVPARPAAPAAPVTTPPRVAPRKKPSKALMAGIAAAACAAIWGMVVLMLNKPGEAAPQSSAVANSASSSAPMTLKPLENLPASQDLLVWLDAGRGLKTKEATVDAVQGDFVDYWKDQSAAGGDNSVGYLHTRTSDDERLLRLPTLGEVDSAHGFKGRFPVLKFGGTQYLLLQTKDLNKDHVEFPNNYEMINATPDRTFFFVVRFSADSRQELLACTQHKEGWAWDVYYQSGRLWAGSRASGNVYASVPLNPAEGFHVVVVTHREGKGTLVVQVTTSAGRAAGPAMASSLKKFGPTDRLRLGAAGRVQNGGKENYELIGDLAEVLMYGRALGETEQQAVVDSLRKKYFGA